ncbi:MAG: polysaccharide deacetylase family protein [Ruminococcus sp.]|nr:polysaccharide deacetylase family protein [Ruminococcus sp.]
MIIRIRKIHFLALAAAAICISFIFAIRAEIKPITVSAETGIKLPIIMYHHVTEKDSRAGAYVIKKSELEADLDYIKKHGYTTVNVQDIVDYVHGNKSLPDKIVMITFDDGFKSVYELAWPLFKAKKMKAVISPVGTITQLYTKNGDTNINYAYMTWSDLEKINNSSEFEVQNHSYNMHHSGTGERKGISKMSGESEEKYKTALTDDLTKMQNYLKSKSNVNAIAAVYPYGSYSKSTLSIVKSLGFKCTMLCEERINTIYVNDPESLYNLGRFNRPSGKSSDEFFKNIL